jgi:hypothetical protein
MVERQQKYVDNPPTGPGVVEAVIMPTNKSGLVEWFNDTFSEGDLHGERL